MNQHICPWSDASHSLALRPFAKKDIDQKKNHQRKIQRIERWGGGEGRSERECDIETWNAISSNASSSSKLSQSLKTIITKTLWNEEECEKLFDMIRNLILILYICHRAIFVCVCARTCLCSRSRSHSIVLLSFTPYTTIIRKYKCFSWWKLKVFHCLANWNSMRMNWKWLIHKSMCYGWGKGARWRKSGGINNSISRRAAAAAAVASRISSSSQHKQTYKFDEQHTHMTQEKKITILLTAWETFIKYSVILSLMGAH